jgi:hypothetical protein
MISIEDIHISKAVTEAAETLYKSGKLGNDVNKALVRSEKLDLVTNFSICLTRLVISRYLRMLFQEFDIKFKSLTTIDESPVRGVRLYEYTYALPNGESFHAILASQSENAPSSLYALADSIFAYRTKNGCSKCDYSEEGCERCGFNKARKLINSKGYKTFTNTCEPLFKVVGDKLVPLFNLIDWTIKYRQNNPQEEEDEKIMRDFERNMNEAEGSDEDGTYGFFDDDENSDD